MLVTVQDSFLCDLTNQPFDCEGRKQGLPIQPPLLVIERQNQHLLIVDPLLYREWAVDSLFSSTSQGRALQGHRKIIAFA